MAAPGANLDEDGWADVGAGIIDWARYRREALAAGAQWLVVEHDKPRDPAASVRASRAHLERLAEAA